MSRYVLPHAFILHSSLLEESFRQGRAKKVVGEFLPSGQKEHAGLPVALRWTTLPALGFPRQPFDVYRRRRERFPLQNVIGGESVIAGRRILDWGRNELFEVEFLAKPDPGSSLIVEALDWENEVIPGQRIVFTENRPGRFRVPGIAALRAAGNGKILSLRGVSQFVVANDPLWQRFEVVGFPFHDGELPPNEYDTRPQWLDPPAKSGIEAAKLRLEIARLMQLPPPGTGLSDIPTVDWPAPEPDLFLQSLRDADTAPLTLIKKCLAGSNDADPDNVQSKFSVELAVEGIRHTAGPVPPGDPAQVHLPVVAMTMLAAGNDSFAATGLGYGTIDFPPPGQAPIDDKVIMPPGTVHAAFDYMVATAFNFPIFGRLELAALAFPLAGPEPAVNFEASSSQRNRPPARDEFESEAVELKWRLAGKPQGYALAASRKTGVVEVLNERRLIASGYQPFIPERPPSIEGEAPTAHRTSFLDTAGIIPLSGSQSSRYLVAALDVFGRWSAWRVRSHTAFAPEVTSPGLHAVTIVLAPETAVGHLVSGRIEIDFSWDWTDRSPARIEFTGRFHPAGNPTTPPATTRFAMRQSGPAGPPVVVAFDPVSETPAILSAHAGSVTPLLEPPPPGDSAFDVRNYRLVVENMAYDFATAPALAYGVFARGVEKVRPTQLSAVVGPKMARTHDPLPPEPPAVDPVDLRWTALPDATGIARGLLRWNPVAGAKGYVVWEATETAVRQLIDPDLPAPAAGTPMLDRARALRDLIAASPENQAKSMLAFSRLQPALITATKLELQLPAAADTISIYRISAVGQSNTESERTEVPILFAVPRQNRPGQPKLILRPSAASPRFIKVIALPGPGVPPAGFRIYRARNATLAQETGLMGPPKYEFNDPRWQSFDLPASNGAAPASASALDDPVPESWYPYFYRLIAAGLENLAAGEFRGESLPSAAQRAFLPPSDPPLLEAPETIYLRSIVADVPVGAGPMQVVVDETTGKVYVADFSANAVSVVDDGGVRTINVQPNPYGLALDTQRRRLYVSNYGANRVTVIDTAAEVVLAEILLTDRPGGVAVNGPANLLYASHYFTNRIAVIDARTNTVAATIGGVPRPWGLAYNPATDKLYVANYATDRVTVIDSRTNTVASHLTVAGRPRAVAVNASTNKVYVTLSRDNSLAIIDGGTDTIETIVATGDRPQELAVNPARDEILVSNFGDNSLAIVDGRSQQVSATISVPSRPRGVAVNSGSGRIYIAQFAAATLAIIDAAPGGPGDTNRVLRFRTNLPVRRTPLGPARIEIFRVELDASGGRLERHTHLTVAAHEVAEGTPLDVLAAPTPEQLAAMPEMNRGPANHQGEAGYSVRVRAADFHDAKALVVVRDPLGRAVEAQFPEVR